MTRFRETIRGAATTRFYSSGWTWRASRSTHHELDRVSIVGGASVYPFVQNVLLAAHAEGAGAAITTLLCAREGAIGDLCRIPEGFALAALMTLGHPVPQKVPRRLSRCSVPEFAFIEEFGGPPLSEIVP